MGFMIRYLNLARSVKIMSSTALDKIPEVDVDATGVFKYILIKLTIPSTESGGESQTKLLVRGYAECNYHADINDIVTENLEKLKKQGVIPSFNTKVLGGGRIILDSPNKCIKVYGYSQGYGKADHSITVALLRKIYGDHDISCSDEGY